MLLNAWERKDQLHWHFLLFLLLDCLNFTLAIIFNGICMHIFELSVGMLSQQYIHTCSTMLRTDSVGSNALLM